MTFASPGWLWALLTIPILVLVFIGSESQRRKLIETFVASRLATRLAGTSSAIRRQLRFGLHVLALALTITALARPQWGFTWEEARRKGRDVLIAVDTSRSMLADDIRPNRLVRSKLAAQNLIQELEGDRIGIIAFAGTAFLQAPLTVDHSAVLSALNELDTEIIPQGGTNLAGALTAARAAFGKGESDSRALIVFSDGEELDADAATAVRDLEGEVKVFTVGVGTPEGALIPVRGPQGGTEFVKDADGNLVRSKLDEERLRAIAEATGGFYTRLETGRIEMERIVRDGLGQLRQQELDARMTQRPIERYQWPLTAAVLAMAVALLIRERRRTLAAAVALAVMAAPSQGALFKNPGVALSEQGKHEEAHAEFSRQVERLQGAPEAHYNLGTSEYALGQFDQAMRSFSKGLLSRSPSVQVKSWDYLGNTFYRVGEQKQKPEEKLADWREALKKYDAALAIDPDNSLVREHRDFVQRKIEELEQQQQEQQKDQQNQDQDQKDESKSSSSDGQKPQDGSDPSQQPPNKGDEQKDEQQASEGGDSKEEKGSDDQKNSQGQSSQDRDQQQPQPQQNQDGQQDAPEQGEEKKEGELKGAPGSEAKENGPESDAMSEADAAAEGRMTQQQARALFESLKSDDQKVRLLPPSERRRQPRVFKDW